jgi:hypothetical protein
MKTFQEFAYAMRMRESSNNYCAKNHLGYLGAYQFGMPRLSDYGITRSLIIGSQKNSEYIFNPPMTEEDFLLDDALQDEIFQWHVKDLKKRLLRLNFTDGIYNRQKITVSGAVGAAHLLGIGGVIDFWQHAMVGADALGTQITEYINLFNGYDISNVV